MVFGLLGYKIARKHSTRHQDGNADEVNIDASQVISGTLDLARIPLISYNKLDTLDTPADGEVLSYNATNDKLEWIPVTAGGYNVVTVTANYNASNKDCVLVDASASAVTITLPTPSSNAEVIIKKIDSSANTVTIAPSGTETIDGAASQSLTTQWESIHVISDGVNWYII